MKQLLKNIKRVNSLLNRELNRYHAGLITGATNNENRLKDLLDKARIINADLTALEVQIKDTIETGDFRPRVIASLLDQIGLTLSTSRAEMNNIISELDSDIDKTVDNAIVYCRKISKLSVKQIAEKLGTSVPLVYKYAKDDDVSANVLSKMIEADLTVIDKQLLNDVVRIQLQHNLEPEQLGLLFATNKKMVMVWLEAGGVPDYKTDTVRKVIARIDERPELLDKII